MDIPLNFFPKAPDIDIDGRIISVVDGVSLIGQYQVVVLNRGARNGLAPGDVLTVFQAGEVVRDRYAGGSFIGSSRRSWVAQSVTLPDEAAGTIMVFKVYDRIGYGLVMEATSDIHVLDAVRNPILTRTLQKGPALDSQVPALFYLGNPKIPGSTPD